MSFVLTITIHAIHDHRVMLLLVSTVIKRKLAVIFLIGLKTVSVSTVATQPLLLVTVNIMYMIPRQEKEVRVASLVRAQNIQNTHPVSKRLKVE